MMALYELWDEDLQARSRLDLGFIGSKERRNRYGLKTLSQCILGVDLPKPKKIATSNWSAVPLSHRQIAYSARDAWAGAAIAARLADRHPQTFGHDSLMEYLEASEPSISELVRKLRRRNDAKRALRKLLAPYRHKMWTVPSSVEDEVKMLRKVIQARVIDRHLAFQVNNLLDVD